MDTMYEKFGIDAADSLAKFDSEILRNAILSARETT
jgi:hypothetical protein